MADRARRHPRNAPGPFYTDTGCGDCDSCRRLAPGIFEHDVAGAYSYVKRQPATPGEVAAARQAMRQCATGAIGDDGDREAPPPATAGPPANAPAPPRSILARIAAALGLR